MLTPRLGEFSRALNLGSVGEANMIVLFISDHGDFRGHNNMLGEARFLHDSLLRVPMIWYALGSIRQCAGQNEVAQLIDVFPTMLELTGSGHQQPMAALTSPNCPKGPTRRRCPPAPSELYHRNGATLKRLTSPDARTARTSAAKWKKV